MTISKSDLELSFYQSAKKALEALDVTAIAYLRDHPKRSLVELAKMIGMGTSARGLTNVIYQEAKPLNKTRIVAKDLLFRELLREFPQGWYHDEKVHPLVKLGGWYDDICAFSREYSPYSDKIITDLTINDVPHKGWKPESADDEKLSGLFDKHWPK